jgi:hypothetical protein
MDPTLDAKVSACNDTMRRANQAEQAAEANKAKAASGADGSKGGGGGDQGKSTTSDGAKAAEGAKANENAGCRWGGFQTPADGKAAPAMPPGGDTADATKKASETAASANVGDEAARKTAAPNATTSSDTATKTEDAKKTEAAKPSSITESFTHAVGAAVKAGEDMAKSVGNAALKAGEDMVKSVSDTVGSAVKAMNNFASRDAQPSAAAADAAAQTKADLTKQLGEADKGVADAVDKVGAAQKEADAADLKANDAMARRHDLAGQISGLTKATTDLMKGPLPTNAADQAKLAGQAADMVKKTGALTAQVAGAAKDVADAVKGVDAAQTKLKGATKSLSDALTARNDVAQKLGQPAQSMQDVLPQTTNRAAKGDKLTPAKPADAVGAQAADAAKPATTPPAAAQPAKEPTAADKAKQEAEAAQKRADEAKTTADDARNAADAAQKTADDAKKVADDAQKKADDAKKNESWFDRLSSPTKAEQAQKDADAAKKVATEAQNSADQMKHVAEETKKTAEAAQKTATEAAYRAGAEAEKEKIANAQKPAAPTPEKTALDKVLDGNPNIKSNQDLINKFYKDGGGTWDGAVQQAKAAGITMNELVKNRQGAATATADAHRATAARAGAANPGAACSAEPMKPGATPADAAAAIRPEDKIPGGPDRSQFDRELQNPAVRERMKALAVAEVGHNPQAQRALMETIFNRAQATHKSLSQTMNAAYYEPMQHGGGAFNRAMSEVRSNPALSKSLDSAMFDVRRGSNVSHFATDNASGSVAASARRTQAVTAVIGGETFSRKEGPRGGIVHPDYRPWLRSMPRNPSVAAAA